jgi:hypothetical protein
MAQVTIVLFDTSDGGMNLRWVPSNLDFPDSPLSEEQWNTLTMAEKAALAAFRPGFR